MAAGGYTDPGIERWAFMRNNTYLYWRLTPRTALFNFVTLLVIPVGLYYLVDYGDVRTPPHFRNEIALTIRHSTLSIRSDCPRRNTSAMSPSQTTDIPSLIPENRTLSLIISNKLSVSLFFSIIKS
jgi:hypothetical protein